MSLTSIIDTKCQRLFLFKKLLSKIEGKGNGIKTVIPNLSDIAKALARPAAYPIKCILN
jgi:translation initiation factor 2 beta subunit (eIF-2beta)/eIF-5